MKVKKFSAVKEVKRLSRELMKTRKGRVIQPKKRELLEKAEREDLTKFGN
jgi:hypothetical protein